MLEKNKKSILIVNQEQYGYHIDTLYYCKYLCNKMKVTYLCWDQGLEKYPIIYPQLIYIKKIGNKIHRFILFISNIVHNVINNSYDIIIIKYFTGCILLKVLLYNKILILDIRTKKIHQNTIIRNIYDMIMILESKIFRNITIISKELINVLHISKNKNVYILPLGAEVISNINKKFDEIRLLYVGTLSCRNIEDTVSGLKQYIDEYNPNIKITYSIIGFGTEEEELKLINTIDALKMYDIVTFHRRVSHNNLKKHFDTNNVGISYVPITKYFNYQPPTKLFEYMLSGMPVIATRTYAQSMFINEINGILIKDNPTSFKNGIMKIIKNKDRFNSEQIRKSVNNYTWEKIVENWYSRYINKL